MFYRSIIICGLIAAAYSKALTEEQIKKLMGYHSDCLAETGVSEEIVNKARQGDFTDDESLKNFLFCMGKKIGFQNDAGELQKDAIKQKLSDFLGGENVDSLIEKCALQRDNPGQTAYDSVICYRENTPSHITLA